jgi:peptidoglycan/LPS O-acetylase OafA/YrhL
LALFPNHPVYTGQHAAWWHDFFDVRAQLGPRVFLGNALFLQNVVVPSYGSNAPLWSLAFEFWYYVAFPLLWFALSGSARPFVRAAYLILGVALLMLLGRGIASYFPLWLLGAALWLLPRSAFIARRARVLTWLVGMGFGVTVLATHSVLSSQSVILRDYLIAVSFAALAYVLLHDGRVSAARAGGVGTLLAGQSYTLYVVHVPLIVFCRAWLGSAAGQWHPEPRTLAYAAGLTVVAFMYAFVISRLTEAHTDTCRAWLQARLWPPPVLVAPSADTVTAGAIAYPGVAGPGASRSDGMLVM